ncbi:DUF1330 domain-containing protein [uncultured Tenacibaculum sp.]|uniref:DUF1330 domain-containing protein n=1 Tax=uncultured Tenacibaculum sp. TaxID=174713 RepID=UPI00261C4350|nr:DUF1330 domain-containing protein [uncultured Tenacibaculum sp.]
MRRYVEVTQESGKEFFKNYQSKGRIVMLNLLKFKDVADYTDLETIKPDKEISGKEAYELYMTHTLPCIKKYGSEVLFKGNSGDFVIGPTEENWDYVLLVAHESVETFMKFAQDKEYLKTAGHRKAALLDSRLLPIQN